jgi:anti-sigma factor RsiW
MRSHEHHREALGAYTLGALSPEEMAAVDRHLRECSRCRDELKDLETLRPILDRRLGASGLTWPLGRRPRRRRSRLLRAWLAGGVLVLLVAVGLASALLRVSPAPTVYAFTSVDPGVHASGTVSYEKEAWGTQMVIRMVGLPASYRCVIWVESRAGRWQEAGSWRAGAGRETEVEAASVLPARSILGVSLKTPAGVTLLQAGGPGRG